MHKLLVDFEKSLPGIESVRCLCMTKAERPCNMLISLVSNGGTLFFKDLNMPYSTPKSAYALDQWGCLRAYEDKAPDGLFLNHSSFNKGRGVICAGDITVDDGSIVYINNFSGHYKPTHENLHNAVVLLHNDGVDISRIEVETDRGEGRRYKVNGEKFAADINAGYGQAD